MSNRLQVEIAPEQGFVLLGGARVAIAPDANRSFLVESSAQIRAVSFGERGSLLLEAMGSDDVSAALSEMIVYRSVLRHGAIAADTLQALALALAGGGNEDWSFADAARRAGEQKKWTWEQTLNMPAWLVDEAAGSAKPSSDSWKMFVFPRAVDLVELSREMAENLLRRSIGAPAQIRGESAIAEPASIDGRREGPSPVSRPTSSHRRGTPSPIPDHTPTEEQPKAVRASSASRVSSTSHLSFTSRASSTHPVRSVKGTPVDVAAPSPSFGPQRTQHSSPRMSQSQQPLTSSPQSLGSSVPLVTKDRGAAVTTVPTSRPSPVATIEQHSAVFTSTRQKEIPDRSRTQGSTEQDFSLQFPTHQLPIDWVLDLAHALEAECDMRGID
jgi:hypothetical protein